METRIAADYDEMSRLAAQFVATEISCMKKMTICFATGWTPDGLYKRLVRMHNDGKIDFSGIISFNLDEYHPIKNSDRQSYFSYMHENLFNHVNISPESIHLLDGEAPDPEAECARYEALLLANPIDLQILGIGENGHIGFNEPGTPFDSRTGLRDLTSSTRKANARYFSSAKDVPRHALAMGLADIMRSKRILLIASGSRKAIAVREMICGRMSRACPATILRRHPDVTVIVDQAAAGLLDKRI